MMHIKSICCVLFFAMLYTGGLAQNYGWKTIEKAQNYVESEMHLNKVPKLLAKAKNANYGTCGNSYAEAFWYINYTWAQYYIAIDDWHAAKDSVNTLKSCSFGGNCHQSDSLRYVIYSHLYGGAKMDTAMNQLSGLVLNKDTFSIKYNRFVELTLPGIGEQFTFSFDWETINALPQTFTMKDYFEISHWQNNLVLN